MTDLSGARTPAHSDPQARLWTRSFTLIWALMFLTFCSALQARG